MISIQKDQIDTDTIYLVFNRAVNEARTRDPQLGKLVLYQLSYYRIIHLKVLMK